MNILRAHTNPARMLALVVVLVIATAACGSASAPVASIAVVPTSAPSQAGQPEASEPAAQPAPVQATQTNAPATKAPATEAPATSAVQDEPAEQPPADDELPTIDELIDDWQPYEFTMPTLAPVTLPDLSELGAYGKRLESDLAGFIGSGLDVVTVACAGDGSDELYVGDSGGFLDAGPGGSGTVDFFDDEGWVNYTVNADGSGEYQSTSEPFISLEVAADGSGNYYRSSNGGADTIRVDVDAAGHGDYVASNDAEFVSIGIGPDETGDYRQVIDAGTGAEITLDYEVRGNGLGNYNLHTDEVFESHSRTESYEDYTLSDQQTGNRVGFHLKIDSPGSDQLFDDSRDLHIWVETDGTATLSLDGESFDFRADGGLFDPTLAVVTGETVYAVADRFPALDTLPPLEPVCATVIRIDSSVLFDFDSAELRPEAGPVLEELVRTLAGTSQGIEIHGHTDSKGDDAYNLDLSDRRAASVLVGLLDRGLDVGASTVGFGETRPIAPNETLDGDDNPAGRQLNRRVEIVVRGQG